MERCAGWPVRELLVSSWFGSLTSMTDSDRPHINMVPTDKNASRVAFEGWLTVDAAKHLLQLAGAYRCCCCLCLLLLQAERSWCTTGQDYEALKQRAHTRQHKSFELSSASISVTIHNQVRSRCVRVR